MSDNTFMSLLGIGTLFPEEEIGAWFDDITKKIEKQKDEETVKSGRASAA